MSKALVIIDIQNDITKNYRDIIDKINKSVEWAQSEEMYIVYIKHNNITAGTRTFKPDTRGEQLVPELSVVSDYKIEGFFEYVVPPLRSDYAPRTF